MNKDLQPIIDELDELEKYVNSEVDPALYTLMKLSKIKKMIQQANFTYMLGLRER